MFAGLHSSRSGILALVNSGAYSSLQVPGKEIQIVVARPLIKAAARPTYRLLRNVMLSDRSRILAANDALVDIALILLILLVATAARRIIPLFGPAP